MRVVAVAVASVAVASVAVASVGCSTGARPEDERLEDGIRALAEAGERYRLPEAAHVGEVVCERISSTTTYECFVNYGEGAPFAISVFCAELRDGRVYMSRTREGCGPPSQYRRATPDDFQ